MSRLTAILTISLCGSSWLAGADFSSNWRYDGERIWIGPEYWANRLQDWRLRGSRAECVPASQNLGLRTLHLLSYRLEGGSHPCSLQVRMGGDPGEVAAQGVLLGVGGEGRDPRSAALVHNWPGVGGGLFLGLDADGRAVIRDNAFPSSGSGRAGEEGPLLAKAESNVNRLRVLLTITAEPVTSASMLLRVTATDDSGKSDVAITVPSSRIRGNVALAAVGSCWFADWRLSGPAVVQQPSADMGPIISTQHTLSRGVLKLTAQLAPVGARDATEATLQIKRAQVWRDVARAPVVTPGYTATFRVASWNDARDVPYRVRYQLADGTAAYWGGTIRRDPAVCAELVIAGFTGNHNSVHGLRIGGLRNWEVGMAFPHEDLTSRVAEHRPDLLFFSGDQIYEGASPTFADRKNLYLDYLYKWYLWCWAYRHLTRDIPTVCIPDDHDVYQGNLWGEGGRLTPGRDHHGGYVHPADFVRMVERTQTSHLPDPFDPTPVEQGIGVYYTSMTYGGVGFAILEDRKFKSGCARPEMPASKTGRPDHFNDPEFDTRDLDIAGVTLLGDRQLEFLDAWARDWQGEQMKVALSQTVFANLATHHGGGLKYLIADLDSNGWPQSGRNRALRALRKASAFHLCGDQHLATITHHGIERSGDAGWSFCVPSILNFYPRAYAPLARNSYERPLPEDFVGPRRDGFGNWIHVHAATNPGAPQSHAPAEIHDRMPGYGIVRLNKRSRTVAMECWPRHAQPGDPAARQYEGWPKTIHQHDNDGRLPSGYLPWLKFRGICDPVVEVTREEDGELLYAVRIQGRRFRPPIFGPGRYRVRISAQATPSSEVRTVSGLEPVIDSRASLELRF